MPLAGVNATPLVGRVRWSYNRGPPCLSDFAAERSARLPFELLDQRPMRLLLLAHDVTVLPFLAALRTLPDWELAAAWTDSPQLRETLCEEHPACDLVHSWDELLTIPADAVLLAGMSDPLLAAAGQFAQARLPLLVVTDLTAGPEALFRLMGIRQEHPHALLPLFCAGVCPYLERTTDQRDDEHPYPPRALAEALTNPLRKVDFVRRLPSHIDLTPSEIDRWLMQDLEWLQRLAGRGTNVTMRTSAAPSGRVIEAEVILTGESPTECRWTLQALSHAPGWRCGLHGEGQETALEVDAGMPHAFRLNGVEHRAPFEDGRIKEASWQLQRIAGAIQRSSPTAGQTGPRATWEQVLECGQVCAVARRSLARRRTLEVQREENSELNQFKSQMTAAGCGALLWALLGVVALLTVSTILDPRDREYRISKAAGFVLWDREFSPPSGGTGDIPADLTARGWEHLRTIQRRWSATSPIVIVETGSGPRIDHSRDRKELVLRELQAAGLRDADKRIVVREIPGRWFERLVLLGWAVVLGPLALVLAMQGLIFAARPPESASRAVR